MKPNNPSARHSGPSTSSGQADLRSGRNPAIKTSCEADKTQDVAQLTGDLLITWIPAFAGMTGFNF
jgi:hypothetical protein